MRSTVIPPSALRTQSPVSTLSARHSVDSGSLWSAAVFTLRKSPDGQVAPGNTLASTR